MSSINELSIQRALPQPCQSTSPGPATLAGLAPAPVPVLGRHRRRCAVCHHPDCDLIEEHFLNWHRPLDISVDFQLADKSSIYRHAHAFGLFDRRRRNIRCVTEQILEKVDGVRVTAHSVLQALRAFTQITEDGQWIEPPKRVVVTHIVQTESASARSNSIPLPQPQLEPKALKSLDLAASSVCLAPDRGIRPTRRLAQSFADARDKLHGRKRGQKQRGRTKRSRRKIVVGIPAAQQFVTATLDEALKAAK
jgi:hypothetical protein